MGQGACFPMYDVNMTLNMVQIGLTSLFNQATAFPSGSFDSVRFPCGFSAQSINLSKHLFFVRLVFFFVFCVGIFSLLQESYQS